ncbi:hypothetical protein [Thalassoglobus sp.]|uniref:hypothetical protein n=1 Tax=Thalassoglobus sp. TaxID=2795869 RepID=UPI003AA9358B
MKNKSITRLTLTFTFALALFAGCSGSSTSSETTPEAQIAEDARQVENEERAQRELEAQ